MAPTDSAKVSLLSFFAGLSFLIVPLVTSSNEWFGYYILYYWPPLFVIHAVVVNVIFHRIYTGPIYQVCFVVLWFQLAVWAPIPWAWGRAHVGMGGLFSLAPDPLQRDLESLHS